MRQRVHYLLMSLVSSYMFWFILIFRCSKCFMEGLKIKNLKLWSANDPWKTVTDNYLWLLFLMTFDCHLKFNCHVSDTIVVILVNGWYHISWPETSIWFCWSSYTLHATANASTNLHFNKQNIHLYYYPTKYTYSINLISYLEHKFVKCILPASDKRAY